jgi:hypothetical protein
MVKNILKQTIDIKGFLCLFMVFFFLSLPAHAQRDDDNQQQDQTLTAALAKAGGLGNASSIDEVDAFRNADIARAIQYELRRSTREDYNPNRNSRYAADLILRVVRADMTPKAFEEFMRNEYFDYNPYMEILELLRNTNSSIASLVASLDSDGADSFIRELRSNAEADYLTENGTALSGGLIGTIGSGTSCSASCPFSCGKCPTDIRNNHVDIRNHTTDEFIQHRDWIRTDFFSQNILPALQLMTAQLSTTAMQQVQIVGTFFDAKHQLETQRIFQTLTAQAHKDYHPSEGLCTIGTNTRSLAASERKSTLVQQTLAQRMMDRQLLSGGGVSQGGATNDRQSRLAMFINNFCNRNDGGGSLYALCESGVADPEQVNMDVNYTGAIEDKLTLNIDFLNTGTRQATSDEENIFALGANLFANEVLPNNLTESIIARRNLRPTDAANYYLDIRAVAAKRSVAQNSFAAITSLKAEGDDSSAPFLKAILKETGINPNDIEDRLGEKPSYFAQMEVLTKDIYQNPTFYANLYDKPVNVERKGVALQAIELMQDRDLYKSLLRSEAVLATLIETLLRSEHDRISNEINGLSLDGERINTAGSP